MNSDEGIIYNIVHYKSQKIHYYTRFQISAILTAN